MTSGKKNIEANVYKKIISKLKNNCLPQGLLSFSREFLVCLQCFFLSFFPSHGKDTKRFREDYKAGTY